MKINNADELCAYLVRMRKEKGLSQAEIAEAMSMDRTAFSKMESNKNRISLDRFISWASVLNFQLNLKNINE